ncbi:hypothetical protein V6N13_113739 [Hibiscus sabdariffa]|uniref:Uncharacterized protein n=1 Tax=Hibiscus sabdariffa TaxID=183260 RepID=A0ABR2TZW7_9ROSI
MCEAAAAAAAADAVVCNQTHTPEFPTPPLELSVQLPQSTTPPLHRHHRFHLSCALKNDNLLSETFPLVRAIAGLCNRSVGSRNFFRSLGEGNMVADELAKHVPSMDYETLVFDEQHLVILIAPLVQRDLIGPP